MKESKALRYIIYFFRASGFCPVDVRTDFSNSLFLKINISWYIYTMFVTLISLINVVDVTVKPNWDISNFHGLVSYTRLIMVSLDALICYTEALSSIRLHMEFFETLAKLKVVLKKFKTKVSYKRLQFWVPVSLLLLATLNVIPQIIYIYFKKQPKNVLMVLQFEIPNFLASVKSLQIIFYAFLIDAHFNVLSKVQESYDTYSRTKLTFHDFNQYHNHMCSLIDVFNKCFGWSILVNVTRDFIFFGEGSYIMLFSLTSFTQAMLLVLIWSHIVYCVLLCGTCQAIHRKALQLKAIGQVIERTKIEAIFTKPILSGFSLKALHTITTFNALGCFVIDLKLLYSFFAFLTNYLLICVQFTLAGEGSHF